MKTQGRLNAAAAMLKRVLPIMFALLIAQSAGAETLSRIFDAGKKFPDAEMVPVEKARNLMAMNDWRYNFETFEMCVVSDGLTDAQLNDSQQFFARLLHDIPMELTVIQSYNSFNIFGVYAEPSDQKGVMNVLIYQQANFYGRRIMFFGKMTQENLMLLDAGDVNMGYFGTEVRPMAPKFMQLFEQLQNEQNQLKANKKNMPAEEYQKRMQQITQRAAEVEKMVKRAE